MKKKPQKGDWVYNPITGKVGLVKRYLPDPTGGEVEVVYAAPVTYTYSGAGVNGLNASGQRVPIVEVLTTALAVMKLLEEIIPIAETIWAALVRMFKATFGTQEEKMALASYREAKAMERELRKQL